MEYVVDASSVFVVRRFSVSNAFGNPVYERVDLQYPPIGPVQRSEDAPSVFVGDRRENHIERARFPLPTYRSSRAFSEVRPFCSRFTIHT